ncbi:erythromycin esterase family protein [Streptomyces sp. NPDC000410]|uniref:erythromycin esterase family protein n=1 Tax=Streptomyces sp. NPDC000410 TaxID=3154254 RepID=UPI0033238C2C
MYSHTPLHRLQRLLLLVICLGALVVTAPVARARPAPPTTDDPLRALAASARPLDDLRPLGRMVGDAKVVGVGEATHNSKEFFTTKHRIFEYLVERKGFTTFALEANWSAGLRLDDFVLHGKGDPRQIMREEFQNSYAMWDTQEYLDLVNWMRQHNLRHPGHPVRFMGNDVGHAGPALFDRVTAYVGTHYPELSPRVTALYRASRPTGGVDESMDAYLQKPLPERGRMARDVQEAYDLLAKQRPGPDRAEHAWVLQHARAIAQTGRMFSYDFFDPADLGKAMRYRDQVMAENTVWWQRRTGDRILLSAHNGHVGYETSNPAQYPKLQGAFLREALGAGYVNVGFTFGQGSFNALDVTDPAEPIRTFSVGPMPAGSNEHTLEQVSRRDFYLDMRTAPRAAREWLGTVRQTRSIGNSWPAEPEPVRLATSYDALIHLHRVTAADRL